MNWRPEVVEIPWLPKDCIIFGGFVWAVTDHGPEKMCTVREFTDRMEKGFLGG